MRCYPLKNYSMNKLRKLYYTFKALPLWKRLLIAVPLCGVIVAAAALPFLLKPDPALAAISARTSCPVEVLSRKDVPLYVADSLLFADARTVYNYAADRYKITLKYSGTDDEMRRGVDSLFYIASALQSELERLKSLPTERATLLRYIQNGDTLTAVVGADGAIVYPR